MSFVYKFTNFKNEIIYIGKTSNLEKRMQQHFNGTGHLPKECYESVNQIFFIQVDGKTNVDMYETFLINKYHPQYNTDKQFNELLYLHNNDFIQANEVDWQELFFQFTKKGIVTQKTKFKVIPSQIEFNTRDKATMVLENNYFQLLNRYGLYQHYMPNILKENQELINYLLLLHKEILLTNNIIIQQSMFDFSIHEDKHYFYVAIDINKIKTINLEYILLMVQTKMLIRITNNVYGIVMHTPYTLGLFNDNYFHYNFE